MPLSETKQHSPIAFTDHQMNQVTSGYYYDKHFSRSSDGFIDLWKVYNLLTGANKSSYIDKYLERSVNAVTATRLLSEQL